MMMIHLMAGKMRKNINHSNVKDKQDLQVQTAVHQEKIVDDHLQDDQSIVSLIQVVMIMQMETTTIRNIDIVLFEHLHVALS